MHVTPMLTDLGYSAGALRAATQLALSELPPMCSVLKD
eukprot:CAMPEP_0115289736 /NCGR_PEP_ID=MMETSP0270-20121206/63668_1 /TAXON_ID=71861 /ORGANISM="Scrippsiella trochoidea, Strain CCMP3099" /LENGTH=37 /DNA_ID= /DNA_START= /DNA_END= /DNA_ORIENTATION=